MLLSNCQVWVKNPNPWRLLWRSSGRSGKGVPETAQVVLIIVFHRIFRNVVQENHKVFPLRSMGRLVLGAVSQLAS